MLHFNIIAKKQFCCDAVLLMIQNNLVWRQIINTDKHADYQFISFLNLYGNSYARFKKQNQFYVFWEKYVRIRFRTEHKQATKW